MQYDDIASLEPVCIQANTRYIMIDDSMESLVVTQWRHTYLFDASEW